MMQTMVNDFSKAAEAAVAVNTNPILSFDQFPHDLEKTLKQHEKDLGIFKMRQLQAKGLLEKRESLASNHPLVKQNAEK